METNREALFARLKEVMKSLEAFLHTSKKLALPLRKPKTHSSRPTYLDPELLSRLKLKMQAIRATLVKADALAMSDAQDRLWLRELRDLECWAEDVVEEIQFEALKETRLEEFKQELMQTHKGKRKRGEFCDLFSGVPSGSLSFKIRRIADRYHQIAIHRDALKITDEDGSHKLSSNTPTPTSSLVKCELHGRENDVKHVIELLLAESTDNGRVFSTIPIVGMAGVGKTTLAQHILQKEVVQSGFDLMIWVSLSQNLSVVEATKKIIENITRSACSLGELESLHHELISHLKGKKFLLVLDDLWDEDPANWSTFRVPLEQGAKGSKVLVTTKSSKVCQIMSLKNYHLRCLSEDACWSVCRQKACQYRKFELCANLTDIGKKVAVKCNGLPLAAVAAGGMLSKSLDEKHWRNVLENPLWSDDEGDNQILRSLIVSYEYLPLPLKRCFAYCSLFPKGYYFEKSKLVQLWFAQGFIPNASAKYFDDLFDWCFFQHAPKHYHADGVYVMRDLYHELAQYVSGCEFNRIEGSKVTNFNDKVRHSSLVPPENYSKEAIKLCSLSGRDLRSFLFLGRTEFKSDKISFCLHHDEIPFCLDISCNIFQNWECLRSLDLSDTDIAELPHSTGNLIHLRYLSLQNTSIRCLPESIGGLFNLFTLNLTGCYYLGGLPRAIKLLDNLRHLYVSVTRNNNIWMPSGIGKLTNLQILPLFVVGGNPDSCGIEELGNLDKLRDGLFISRLYLVSHARIAEKAKVNNKAELQKLTLDWSSADSNVCPYYEEASEVLEILKPNPNLEELHIRGFCGTKLPSWLNYLPEFKLVTLDLKDCRNLEYLPSLGRLPHLKHLHIQSITRLQHIGLEFYGCNGSSSNSSYKGSVSFPVLETLMFKKMDAWEEWVEGEAGDFPCLSFLTLNSCVKLRSLPQLSPSVHLRVRKCPLLNVCMSRPSLEYSECILLA